MTERILEHVGLCSLLNCGRVIASRALVLLVHYSDTGISSSVSLPSSVFLQPFPRQSVSSSAALIPAHVAEKMEFSKSVVTRRL